MKILIFILLCLSLPGASNYEVSDNDNIVYVSDGKKFDSSVIHGKKFLVNYIDPDERDLNEALMDKIEALHPNIGSIAIINLDATWLPNLVLEAVLKENQKKHPSTMFVKDYAKVLVNLWGLKDNDYNVMVFDENRNLIFKKTGKLSKNDETKLIKILTGD